MTLRAWIVPITPNLFQSNLPNPAILSRRILGNPLPNRALPELCPAQNRLLHHLLLFLLGLAINQRRSEAETPPNLRLPRVICRSPWLCLTPPTSFLGLPQALRFRPNNSRKPTHHMKPQGEQSPPRKWGLLNCILSISKVPWMTPFCQLCKRRHFGLSSNSIL